MRKLYALVSVISLLVRQCVLPNPFACFGDRAIVINWIAEPIIHIVAYGLVSLIYRSGECPPWGSFLYLVFYAALTGILALMGVFSFVWWWILLIIVVLVAIGALLAKLGRWFGGKTW